mgnify:CR=1 FL=1
MALQFLEHVDHEYDGYQIQQLMTAQTCWPPTLEALGVHFHQLLQDQLP